MSRHCPDAHQTEPAPSLPPVICMCHRVVLHQRHFGKQKGAWRGIGVSDWSCCCTWPGGLQIRLLYYASFIKNHELHSSVMLWEIQQRTFEVTPAKVHQPPGGGWNECTCMCIFRNLEDIFWNSQKTDSEIMNYKGGRVLLLCFKIIWRTNII